MNYEIPQLSQLARQGYVVATIERPQELNRTGVGDKPQNTIHKGTLATAIRTDDAHKVALVERDINITQRLAPLVTNTEVVDSYNFAPIHCC